MPLTMHQTSIPAFRQMLACLSAILDKAAVHAEAKKIDPAVLLNARLFPDMFPLTKQVQIACDFAKGASARLAGLEPPSFADTETTIPELKQRIAKTLAFLDSLRPEQIDGSEDRDISLKVGGNPMQFKGQYYLVQFALPNFYFHVTAVYAILRHNGLELGKRDYMIPPG